jgi:CBS domain-containing protein
VTDGPIEARAAPEPAALPEVTRFLRAHPPFDALPVRDVERVAAVVEVEYFRAGTAIFNQGAEPVEHLRVVRSGAVEIVHNGRVLDLLGDGDLFGHASMLSGLPPGFQARAAEDTLCYRIDEAVARELLAAPAGLRYVARSLLESSPDRGLQLPDLSVPGGPALGAGNQTVGSLIRRPAVVCAPNATIRTVAEQMSAAGATSVVVELGDDALGILTDRDLRTDVLAAGLSGDAPVSAAMSAPAYTTRPDRLAGEVLLEMLDRGLRHFPVVSARGEVLGVIEDLDLIAMQTRSSFFLRQRIGAATSVPELVAAATELRPAVVAMHEARVAAINIMAVHAVVVDALTRRLVELAVADAGREAEFAWLALGSQARREAVPSSDVDSAIVLFGDGDEEDRRALHALGRTVVAGLRRCGLRPDEHGASASDLRFVRSLDSWQRAGRSFISDPTQDKALILVSVLVDSRPVWGLHTGTPVADTFRMAPSSPALLRLLARFALSHRPPTGFLRGLVVEHSGERRGRLDLKHGGLIPIVDLARWAGMAAGVTSASTNERLRAAGSAGTLPAAEVHTLLDAFALIASLRLGHQVEQIRAGREPDDFVDPATLSPLMRSHLREAFRAVAAIQKRISMELKVGIGG